MYNIKSGAYSIQDLYTKGINCISELLSPLWNGSNRHVYLSSLVGRLSDALKNLRFNTEEGIYIFEQDFIKYVLPYAEDNERKILEEYFPQLF